MRTRGRLEHSLVPFFQQSLYIFYCMVLTFANIKNELFPKYRKRLTLMVGGSIYDTVASRVDIRDFKIRRLRTTDYGWTQGFLTMEDWAEYTTLARKYEVKIADYRHRTTNKA